MITWNDFGLFAVPAISLWFASAITAWAGKKHTAPVLLDIAGICIYAAFIIGLWAGLQRPPLRTMGETRLWYAFFISICGLATFLRWRYKWILFFSALLATVFTIINIAKPEIHDQTLMPALQSPWFIPHVTVYMFSYSVMGCAFILAVAGIIRRDAGFLPTVDNLVYAGMSFLTFGMLSGALWAKEAWGDYWSWDPKETWAVITWGIYLIYIHFRIYGKQNSRFANIIAILGFLALQMCWYGVNYLPSAQNSLHSY